MAQIVTVNCSTGQQTTRALTTQEQADADARAVTDAQRVQTEATARTNRGTIEQAITDALVQLDTLIAATALPALAAIPTIPAGAALTTTQLTTALRALSSWADTAATQQRTANQVTRAGAQQVASTLKRTIRLVRGDFTGTT